MAAQQVPALVVAEHGGVDVLSVAERELPDPAPDEVQVRVAASGVNFIDVYQREGVYPVPTPFVLGMEGAGEIIAVGADVRGMQVGDVVAWADALGSHTGVANVRAGVAVPVADGIDPQVAAAAMLQGMTAHYLVTSTYPVQPGDGVLVHAAAGGVGALLVQMAKARGAHVIGTVSTVEKEAIARAAGADQVIRYETLSTEDLAAEVRRLNHDTGVNVVFDGVGRTTFDASLASLARRGMLVLFGAASGQVAPVDPQRLNRGGSLFLTRPRLEHYIASRDELLWRGGEVLNSIAAGTLRIDVGARYPLADARRAYDDLEHRRTTGKVLLVP
jgi:NADPH:quinone reductase